MRATVLIITLLSTSFLFSCSSMNSHRYPQTKKMIEEASMGEIGADLSSLHDKIHNIYAAKALAEGLRNRDGLSYRVKITGDSTNIFMGADPNSGVVKKALAGESYGVVDKVDYWYAIQFPKPIKDLNSGWVSATQVVPESSGVIEASEFMRIEESEEQSYKDQLYQKIMKSVAEFREKYENNPFVRVSGFSIDIAFPPSVSLDFEFKR